MPNSRLVLLEDGSSPATVAHWTPFLHTLYPHSLFQVSTSTLDMVDIGVILCLSDLLACSQTSAWRPASSTLYACPAVAVLAAPVIVSPVMGLTGLCVPRMDTHMTMTVGASRLSVDNSRPFLQSTRARVVSNLGFSWE